MWSNAGVKYAHSEERVAAGFALPDAGLGRRGNDGLASFTAAFPFPLDMAKALKP
jgi:hypothetical protein